MIPVYFETATDGNYLLTANLQNVNYAKVYLVDNKLNTVHDLTVNPEYAFSALTTDPSSAFQAYFQCSGY